MRVLYLCHRFPFPPVRGGKIRPFNMIKHLSQNHEVVVASLARSPEEAKAGEGIAEHCADYLMEQVTPAGAWSRMIARLATTVPSSMGYFYSPRLARRVRERLAQQKFDLIFVHCSSVAPYVRHVSGMPKILDFGDMDSQKWLTYRHFKPFPLSLGYHLEGYKLQEMEKALARDFDCCTCTTKAELETLQEFATGTPSDWFPNGVDRDFFAPVDEPYDPDAISFVGRMDYFPNQQAMQDFCDQVFPLIQRSRPAARLSIIGAEPSPAMLRLGERDGVTVTGTVPDVRDYVRSSAVAVAPLTIARGTQNKILECMAMGVPVVTSRVAAGGVDALPGEHLLVADSPEETAKAVLAIMGDPAERARLAVAGRARITSHHSWDSSMVRLDGIIETCLRNYSEQDR